jgi:hypothetical protein
MERLEKAREAHSIIILYAVQLVEYCYSDDISDERLYLGQRRG